MKKHELLEEDVRQHRDALETMYTLSKTFFDANHFDRDTIRARQDTLQKRYVNLKVSQSPSHQGQGRPKQLIYVQR